MLVTAGRPYVLTICLMMLAFWVVLLVAPTGVVLQGRLTLMMGPPGGGKSTLLQLLAGMLAGHAIKVGPLFVESVNMDIFIIPHTQREAWHCRCQMQL